MQGKHIAEGEASEMNCSWRVHGKETMTSPPPPAAVSSVCVSRVASVRSSVLIRPQRSLKFYSAAQTRPKPTVPAASLRPERSCFQGPLWGLARHTHQRRYADNPLINVNGAAGFETREPSSHFPNGLRARARAGRSRALASVAERGWASEVLSLRAEQP